MGEVGTIELAALLVWNVDVVGEDEFPWRIRERVLAEAVAL